MKELIGKTIKSVESPEQLEINGRFNRDDNYVITFTDGTILKMSSWDYEGYSSGIYTEIVPPINN